MKAGTDLLNTMGQSLAAKRQGGVETPIRHGQIQTPPITRATDAMPTAIDNVPGSEENDLISRSPAASSVTTDPIGSPAPASATPTVDDGSNPTAIQADPEGGQRTSGQGSWTTESLTAEMRKAREEAKRSRLEKNDAIQRLRAEYDSKLEEIKAATKPLEDQARELADLKAKEADAKKTLAEKLADREAKLGEVLGDLRSLKEIHNREILALKAELEEYRSEINVQNKFYEDKLNEELNTIPEKYKDLAGRLTKGCDSTREALDVIREAKDKGMFKDGKVVVSHAVPTVEEGARLTSTAQRQENASNKGKLTAVQKIGEGLKGMESNPIFKRGRGR